MQISILANDPDYRNVKLSYDEEAAQNALRFHRTLPAYQETPLVSLSCAAELYRVRSIFVKDESFRFGLNAFKGLGGSYSMFRILCDRLSLDPLSTGYTSFMNPELRERCSGIEFVTATDGNHGKGVSWAAKLFGCRAHVFMPKGTVEIRRRAIEEAGSAVAEISEGNYDQTVAYVAFLAEQNGWILIQDTSQDGYEQIPGWIIEGYLTLGAEAVSQMDGQYPTHIFLQAGVGAMAGGLEAFFVNRCRDAKPIVTIVEPEASACHYESALAGDGKAHSIPGNPETIMAGLNCGTPCSLVWPIIRDCSSFFCACGDEVTEAGMRAYARPLGTDPTVISGESGAVTYGLLLEILKSEDLRKKFRIDRDSVIFLISTEGNTDPEGYAKIVGAP